MADYTAAQLTALKAAIASGVLTVHYSDRTVTYRSLDDMLKLLRLMDAEVNPPATAPVRCTYASFGKG